MTFYFSRTSSRRPRAERRETGAATIVLMMMSLVFVPIVLAHIAASSGGYFSHSKIAGFVHLFMQGTASN